MGGVKAGRGRRASRYALPSPPPDVMAADQRGKAATLAGRQRLLRYRDGGTGGAHAGRAHVGRRVRGPQPRRPRPALAHFGLGGPAFHNGFGRPRPRCVHPGLSPQARSGAREPSPPAAAAGFSAAFAPGEGLCLASGTTSPRGGLGATQTGTEVQAEGDRPGLELGLGGQRGDLASKNH